MEYRNILLQVEDKIATVTINRPEALNSLNKETCREILDLFTFIDKDENVDVVILTGAGKAFVAGADIREMSVLNANEGKDFGKAGLDAFSAVENCSKIVIAAVNGFALGGGCELSMACDIRLASTKAKFGQPEVGLGITPGFGGTQRLPRLVGVGKAKELIYRANIIGAEEAKDIGLVNHVYEPEQLMDEARKMAEEIVSKGQLSVRYAKEAINSGLQVDIKTGMEIERSLFGLCFATEDQKEGMAAFLEKRAAKFSGK
ncbi:MAG: enoyl-CoA hydratase-related protein [Filifactoraceae bacterium]